MHGGTDTDEGFEIDGPEGSTNTSGMFMLKNGSVMSAGGADMGTPADLKSSAQGTIDNVIFSGYMDGDDLLKIRTTYQNDCQDVKEDAWQHLISAGLNVSIQFVTSKFAGVKVYTKSLANDGSSTCTVLAIDQSDAEAAAISSNNATGADASVFADWTIASISGKLQ